MVRVKLERYACSGTKAELAQLIKKHIAQLVQIWREMTGY